MGNWVDDAKDKLDAAENKAHEMKGRAKQKKEDAEASDQD